MKQNRHHLFLGIFVLVGLALIGTAVTILGAQALWEKTLIVETYIVEPVNGLEPGSLVKFNGITVGKVEEVSIVSKVYETKETYAYVRANVYVSSLPRYVGTQVSDAIETRVGRGLAVSLASSGITGGSYLEAEYAELSEEPLAFDWTPRHVYVPSRKSTFVRVKDAVENVLNKLEKTDLVGVVERAKEALVTVDESVKSLDLPGLRTKVDDLFAVAKTTIGEAGVDIRDIRTKIVTAVDSVEASLQTTLTAANGALSSVQKVADHPRLGASIDSLATVLLEAETTIGHLTKLVGTTDKTVGSVGHLVRGRSRELGSAVDSLREILENLTSLTGMLERYPSLLFVGNPPKPATTKNKEDK